MSIPAHAKEPLASARLMQMLTAKWVTVAIATAAEMGIADHLAAGDKTTEELATLTSAHEPSLYRLLRALASVGVFAETKARTFTLTPMAQLLRSDSPDSMRAWARFMTLPFCWDGWGQLLHCVETGETAIRKLYGLQNPFEYFKTHPEEAAVFDAAMTDLSRLNAPLVVQTYDFGRFQKLVDIAGGQGLILAAVLERYPSLRGVLFDLPAVIGRAGSLLKDRGVADRCELVSGDFFQSVPAGADGYLMQHIIHDWDDEQSIAILRNIRKAIDPTGRLLLVEAVITAGNEPSPGKLLDLEMLVLPGGRERTESEYRELLASAGCQLLQIHRTGGAEDIIEA